MGKIEDEYTDWGGIDKEIRNALDLPDIPVLIKNSYISDIMNNSHGQFLRTHDIDYDCLGIDSLANVVEFPTEVRDGGNTLILIKAFKDYNLMCNDMDERCYALRIKRQKDETGNDFWECIDFETHYNLKRRDPILWTACK